MAVAEKIGVAEYLSTDYEPDVDYVDGELIERNMGEKSHGKAQLRLAMLLDNLGLFVLIETRLQIGEDRFRVPDVCAYANEPDEEVLRTPPLLCVEILSPEDRMARIESRIADYFSIGVGTVWVVDPYSRNAWIYTGGHRVDVVDGVLRAGEIEVPLSALFPKSA
ncbi:MAG: Uma2 family endonuclease [Bryobacteraceae bacterium]|nr:Uma2 family endonuclease [Bryobacteraceae bacterium]